MKAVYIIASDNGLRKLGASDTPQKRLRQIQAEHRNEVLSLEWTADIERAQWVEEYAHSILKDRHIIGEWFKVSKDEAVAAFDDAIQAVGLGERSRVNLTKAGRPPRAVKRTTVSVRFEPWEIEAIDKARAAGTDHAVTRQDWVARAATALTLEAMKPMTDAPYSEPLVQLHMKNFTARVEAEGRTFGPVRPQPGARLKGGKAKP